MGGKQRKDLKKLNPNIQNKINETFVLLSINLFVGKTMHGQLKKKRSIRLWPYRIIYEIHEKEKKIKIFAIGHRQGVYKKL